MAALVAVLSCRVSEASLSYADSLISGDTLVFADGPLRVPSYLTAYKMSTALETPYIAAVVNATYGIVTQGLHDYAKTAGGNNTPTVLLYTAAKASTDKLITWAVVRLTDAHAPVQVGPAVRVSDGTGGDPAGKKCYATEIHWDSGSSSWKLLIFRYDTHDAIEVGNPFSEGVVATKTQIGTSYTIASFTGHRLLAVGLQAVTNGAQVTIYVWAYSLASGPVFAPGLGTIINLIGNYPFVHSAADTSGSRLIGADNTGVGIKWRPRTAALTVPTEGRIVTEFGLSLNVAGTKPVTPTIDDRIFSYEGARVTLYSSLFSDADGADTHVKSRWLLFERLGGSASAAFPIRDTGFITDLREHVFADLMPGGLYAARVQYLDNDGDVSTWSELFNFGATPSIISVTDADELAHGLIALLHAEDDPTHFGIHRNDAFDFFYDDGATAEQVLVQRHDGVLATSYGAYLTKRADLASWTRRYRHLAFTCTGLLSNGANPVYAGTLATIAFLAWGDAPGFWIGTRSTPTDTDGYYVTKTSSGAQWVYTVTARNLIPNGSFASSTPADWITTTLFTGTIDKADIGLHGERIILASVTVAGTKLVILYVNGIYLGSLYGAIVEVGYGDPGHEFSSLLMERGGSSTVYLQQIGQVNSTAFAPDLPISVVPGERATGAAMHHPGPYMDPFDSGTDVAAVENVWFASGSVFRFRTGAAIASASGLGYLIYWSPSLANFDYTLSGIFYHGGGPVVRFTTVKNHIALYPVTFTNPGTGSETRTLNLAFTEDGIVIALYSVTTGVYTPATDELALQVVNDDTTPGRVYVRARHHGTLLTFTKISGLGTAGDLVIVDLPADSNLLSGRFGVVRSTASDGAVYNLPGNSIPVCGTLTCEDALEINPPATPTVAAPIGEASVKVAVLLSGSTFSDPDAGGTQAAAQWQVYDIVAGQTVFDSGRDTVNFTSLMVTPGLTTWTPIGGDTAGLNPLTAYKYRVRYQDNIGLWSSWSSYLSFTTGDPDTASPLLNALPTYPADPPVSQVFEETIAFQNLVTVFESGKEQRRAKSTRGRLGFRVQYEKITSAQMDVLWNFYSVTAFGILNLFYVVHPRTGQTVHVCRFLEDNLTRSNFEYLLESTGMTLVEVPV